MNSSPVWQSLADSASALRCAAADLSAANGSSRRRDLTSSRVSAALRQIGFTAPACWSASAALAEADAKTAQQAAARQTNASAAMTRKPLLPNADNLRIGG